VLVTTVVGAAVGYFVFHPYTMLVYGAYTTPHEHMPGPWVDHALMHLSDALSTFQPGMLHMGIPYAVMGGITGALYGLWLNGRIRWEEEKLRTCAVDTIKQLMVTMSHYLLNAVTIIGGNAARIERKVDDREVVRQAEVIRKEAVAIEAVVKSLQSAQQVVSEEYTKDSETRILDITDDIKKRMEQSGEEMHTTED